MNSPNYVLSFCSYINSLGGTAIIRTKKEFVDFEKILQLIFLKYIEEKEERDKVTKFVLKEVKTRVLVEVAPEWVKAVRVPKSGN